MDRYDIQMPEEQQRWAASRARQARQEIRPLGILDDPLRADAVPSEVFLNDCRGLRFAARRIRRVAGNEPAQQRDRIAPQLHEWRISHDKTDPRLRSTKNPAPNAAT